MKKILIYLEAKDGALKRTSYEAISAARNLGQSIPIVGILINGTAEQAKTAGEYGLAEVLIAKHPLFDKYSSSAAAKAISQTAQQLDADVLLFAGNSTGLELAPRVAARLDAGYIGDCIALNITDGSIIAHKPIYAGKSVISAKINTNIQVYSLRPNVFTAVKADLPADTAVSDFQPEISEDDRKVYVISLTKTEGKLDVAEADIIVSGGRGIKGPENYHLIESLAGVFGGAVGASRAVVDAGWRPHREQVGQTGKTVSPTLYVACAISGAIQHLAGMSTSKFIVAINKDKDAPIFKVADYGIVGDIFDVLPKLTEKVKQVVGK